MDRNHLDEPTLTNAESLHCEQRGAALLHDPVSTQAETRHCEKHGARILELMCGSARLSAACKARGAEVFPVDYVRNKGNPSIHVFSMDLTQPGPQQSILNMLKHEAWTLVSMAPPCGTASRARERPIPTHLLQPGMVAPKPLRTAQEPWGIAGLCGRDLLHVQQANELYRFVLLVCDQCVSRRIPCFIENPRGSRLWDIHEFKQLLSHGFHDIEYDACMHGGSRKKAQTLRANFPDLDFMAICCDGSHEHLPYTITAEGFDTAAEAAFPLEFCDKIASCMVHAKHVVVPGRPCPASGPTRRVLSTVETGRQPRGRKVPQLISEFRAKLTFPVSSLPQLTSKSCLTCDFDAGTVVIPAGSKVMSATEGVCLDSFVPGSLLCFGIYHSPVEWVSKACMLEYPSDVMASLTPTQAEVVCKYLCLGRAGVASMRVSAIKKYCKLAVELQDEEKRLHGTVADQLKPIIAGKRICLLRELMLDCGVTEPDLINDMVNGFQLVGELKDSGLFEPLHKPCVVSVKQLLGQAAWIRRGIVSTVTCAEGQMQAELEKATAIEVSNGWISEGMSETEVTSQLGESWVPARRFIIQQSGKHRLIDDFSVSSANAAVTHCEKIDVGGIDEILVLAKTLHRCCRTPGGSITDCTGKRHEYVTHDSWRRAPFRPVGRTLDLQAAYKQVGVRPEDAFVSVICRWDATLQGPIFHRVCALPFGASGSVTAFNRCSRVLERCLSVSMCSMMSCYFDDFPVLEDNGLMITSIQGMESMLELLGWSVSKGDKWAPFSVCFQLLGAEINFGDVMANRALVCNTPKRVAELIDAAEAFLSKGMMSPCEAACYAGRLNFARSFVFGKMLSYSLRQLYGLAQQSGGRRPLHPDLVLALKAIREGLKLAKPREIWLGDEMRPAILHTDGAVENGRASCGALMIYENVCQYFQFDVPTTWMRFWEARGTKHAVAQAELLPAILARATWREAFCQRRVIHFTDNESVREALIKGSTKSLASLELVYLVSVMDCDLCGECWVARVPGPSNAADAPSRFRWEGTANCFSAVPVTAIIPDSLGLVFEKG